jgi:hypothetical protein
MVALRGLGNALPAEDFALVAGLPVAVLRFDEKTWNIMRKNRNFTRKLRASAPLRFEEHNGLP